MNKLWNKNTQEARFFHCFVRQTKTKETFLFEHEQLQRTTKSEKK